MVSKIEGKRRGKLAGKGTDSVIVNCWKIWKTRLKINFHGEKSVFLVAKSNQCLGGLSSIKISFRLKLDLGLMAALAVTPDKH